MSVFVKNDDLQPEKSDKSDNKDELFPPKGITGWLQLPNETDECDNADTTSKVAFSEDSDSVSEKSHSLLKECTTGEILAELHARFDHIILLAKRNLAENSKNNKKFSMTLTSMFIGDAHALLGMNSELTDHLKGLLAERREFISECSEMELDEEDEDDES